MEGLTAGFGMGPGVSPPLLPPETFYKNTEVYYSSFLFLSGGGTKFDYENHRFSISLIYYHQKPVCLRL